jgi:aryl-alcohol dehydrogenase-like predicted oxidoreductase
MKTIQLGQSDLQVTPICLGTMTFGEQVDEAGAFDILDRSLQRGVNFIDTAEMYAVPPRAETFNATEKIIGNWLVQRPGARQKLVIATKVAGPSRAMKWIRDGSLDLTGADIIAACEGSLNRLQTDVIDLYQIHWPVRSVPMFGNLYYQRGDEPGTSIHQQLEALGHAGQGRQGARCGFVQRDALWCARVCAPGRAAWICLVWQRAKRLQPAQPQRRERAG